MGAIALVVVVGAGAPLPLVGAAGGVTEVAGVVACFTGPVAGVVACFTALVAGALALVAGALAGVLGWPAVTEVAVPRAEERPSAEAVEVPRAQKTARHVTRASSPAGRTDERARKGSSLGEPPVRCEWSHRVPPSSALACLFLELSEDVDLKQSNRASLADMSEGMTQIDPKLVNAYPRHVYGVSVFHGQGLSGTARTAASGVRHADRRHPHPGSKALKGAAPDRRDARRETRTGRHHFSRVAISLTNGKSVG